jgi:hypothetical protein
MLASLFCRLFVIVFTPLPSYFRRPAISSHAFVWIAYAIVLACSMHILHTEWPLKLTIPSSRPQTTQYDKPLPDCIIVSLASFVKLIFFSPYSLFHFNCWQTLSIFSTFLLFHCSILPVGKPFLFPSFSANHPSAPERSAMLLLLKNMRKRQAFVYRNILLHSYY